jgi:hypothetical protein
MPKGKTISDADRRKEAKKIAAMLGSSGKTISDADRARLIDQYMKRNDGGIAKKARVF